MVNLLIYGIKMQAQQLCYYAELEGAARVVAFVVDAEYQTITELNGHPVITFEECNPKEVNVLGATIAISGAVITV